MYSANAAPGKRLPHNPTPFPNEVLLKIFYHLTDTELLALAPVSTNIHDLALLTHLSRYGISETEIASQNFPEMTTNGAFHAFCLARFVTRPAAIRLRFDLGAWIDNDVRAFVTLARRLPPIPFIEMKFPPRPWNSAANERCDMEALFLALLDSRSSRPVAVLYGPQVDIIRPHNPLAAVLRRLISITQNFASKGATKSLETGGDGLKVKFRKPIPERFLCEPEGGGIHSVTIQLLDPPCALGALVVLEGDMTSAIDFAPEPRLSRANTSAIFANLRLPHLNQVEAGLRLISMPALNTFLSNHPTLTHVLLYGLPDIADRVPHTPLASTTLPNIVHLRGHTSLCAWILQSPHPFTSLTSIRLELYKSIQPNDYSDCLRGIARRPCVTSLALDLHTWHPWAALQDAPVECDMPHVSTLQLTFWGPPPRLARSAIPDLAQWIRLFDGVRRVILIGMGELLREMLRPQCPGVDFN
ncbi:hypothetical protein C8J57DRAFT_287037 [Mycena rebaudengoi]|nr:hypothetical protein C8J57DRAFT_287037 [Mycena rebaudengoi]